MSDTGYSSYRSARAAPAAPSGGGYGLPAEQPMRGHSPLYAQDNASSSGLVRHAAEVPMTPPTLPPYSSREGSLDAGGRRTPTRIQSPAPIRVASPQVAPRSGSGPSVGALGGGPNGYSGLAQAEETDLYAGDPSQYNYFRGGGHRAARPPGQGW